MKQISITSLGLRPKAFIAFVAFAVIVVLCVGIWNWPRYQAKKQLVSLIQEAEAADNPEALIVTLENYVRTHSTTEITSIAMRRLASAKASLDEHDWSQTVNHDISRDSSLSALSVEIDEIDAAYSGYLEKHPTGLHRDEAEHRRDGLSKLRDDRAFESCKKRMSTFPQEFESQRVALNAYLKSFPKGQHESEVRNELEQISEREEAVQFEICQESIRELMDIGDLTRAQNRVEQAQTALKASHRIDKIRELSKAIQTRLEEIDAQQCMLPIVNETAAVNDRGRACEFFHMCYPHSRHQSKIDQQLGSLKELGYVSRKEARISVGYGDPQLALLARLQNRVDSLAPKVSDLLKDLPTTFEFKWFDESLAIPISWSTSDPQISSQLLKSTNDAFLAKIRVARKAEIHQKPSDLIPVALRERIDRELGAVNTTLSIDVELEIRGHSERFVGIGLEFREALGRIEVSKVFDGSSAHYANVEIGDRVAMINGTPLPRGLKLDQFAPLVATPPAKKLLVTLVRTDRRFNVNLAKSDYAVPHYEMRQSQSIEPSAVFGKEPTIGKWTSIDNLIRDF